MNRINPTALIMWIFLALVSYLIWGTPQAAAAGAAAGMGLSILVEILTR